MHKTQVKHDIITTFWRRTFRNRHERFVRPSNKRIKGSQDQDLIEQSDEHGAKQSTKLLKKLNSSPQFLWEVVDHKIDVIDIQYLCPCRSMSSIICRRLLLGSFQQNWGITQMMKSKLIFRQNQKQHPRCSEEQFEIYIRSEFKAVSTSRYNMTTWPIWDNYLLPKFKWTSTSR